MDDAIARHCEELNRCNQRGGRMLSVVDLLEAGTLDLDLGALLMAGMARGASLMVGARPGGAGKTTVMCALLNLAASDVELVAATASAVRHAAGPRRCYVCHEIGSGPYFACLWGRDLRSYCALGEQGHILATNLHADDLEEARAQVCTENRVPAAHFNGFHLQVFLRVTDGWRASRRWIERVYVSDGVSPHVLVFDAQRGLDAAGAPDAARFDGGWVARCRGFLESCRDSGARTIEAVRAQVVRFLEVEGAG